MVVKPNPKWTHSYLAKIDDIERQYQAAGKQEHVCGFPTRGGQPCKNVPATNFEGIINGRCSVHGGYPPIRNIKKGIVTRKVDFMLCDKCDVFTQTEGLKYKCRKYQVNKTCEIEAELYEQLWHNLNMLYEFDTFPQEVMLDSLVRDFVRRDRAWRVENVVGIGISVKVGMDRYYEKATESIMRWFERLGIIGKKTKKKSFGQFADELSKRKL